MIHKKPLVRIYSFFVLDLFLTCLSWNLAYFIRFFWANFPEARSIPEYTPYFNTTWIIALLAVFCFFNSKMYQMKRLTRFKTDFKTIIRAVSLLFLLIFPVFFFFRGFSFSRLQALIFMVLCCVSILLSHSILRLLIFQLQKTGKLQNQSIVIGGGSTAQNFIRTIQNNHILGIEYVGQITKQKDDLKTEFLGGYKDLSQIINRLNITHIFIALDVKDQSDLLYLNQKIGTETVDIYMVPDIFHTLNMNTELMDIGGFPVIAIRQDPLNFKDNFYKRCMDIFGSIFGIIIFFPIWILIPILIKLSSKGPILYAQERVGLDGKSFKILKFRSMVLDAEQQSGAVWAKKGDKRTTRIGSILRKTDLDEFPQLFNVLVGDMSLVGPRPERPVFIEEFKTRIPNYMLRHKMKTGMTGWAQINGWRGDTSLEKRIEFDLYYLTHWSLWFDFKITIMQLFKWFFSKNAY